MTFSFRPATGVKFSAGVDSRLRDPVRGSRVAGAVRYPHPWRFFQVMRMVCRHVRRGSARQRCDGQPPEFVGAPSNEGFARHVPTRPGNSSLCLSRGKPRSRPLRVQVDCGLGLDLSGAVHLCNCVGGVTADRGLGAQRTPGGRCTPGRGPRRGPGVESLAKARLSVIDVDDGGEVRGRAAGYELIPRSHEDGAGRAPSRQVVDFDPLLLPPLRVDPAPRPLAPTDWM
jgi:hypothetical protein